MSQHWNQDSRFSTNYPNIQKDEDRNRSKRNRQKSFYSKKRSIQLFQQRLEQAQVILFCRIADFSKLYELYFVSNLIPFTESLLARLQETGRLNLKVLDVASGTGAATLCLLRNRTAFQLVSATDFSKEMLDILGNLHPVLI